MWPYLVIVLLLVGCGKKEDVSAEKPTTCTQRIILDVKTSDNIHFVTLMETVDGSKHRITREAYLGAVGDVFRYCE